METVIGELAETRFHPRVGAHLMVKLTLNGKAVSARSSDLSMAGLCLRGELLDLQDPVTLTIPLPDEKQLVTEAKVAWRDADKVALEFTQLDWEDMFALARFIHPKLR